MAITQIADVIVPQVWRPYVIERTAELTAFIQSGVLVGDPEFDVFASGPAGLINMPFWNDISGGSQLVTETTGLTTNKISASKDAAIRLWRGQAWATSDLAGKMAGSDPAAAIGDLVAAYWARDTQHTVFNLLNGVFASSSMSGSVLNIAAATGTPTDANCLTALTFMDAGQLLGDARDKLVAISMHSIVETSLRKQDLIDFIPNSEGKPLIKMFQGLQVIVDDGHPVDTTTNTGNNIYTTFLFGSGALALGNGTSNQSTEGMTPGSTWEVEFARNATTHQSILINRNQRIIHPRGVKWNGTSMVAESPTDAELATGTNWTRVYEPKNVRLVQIKHQVLA